MLSLSHDRIIETICNNNHNYSLLYKRNSAVFVDFTNRFHGGRKSCVLNHRKKVA